MNDLKFTVGSNVYTVAEVEGFMRKYDLYGQVLYSDCHIEIESRMAPTRKTNVIIHELLHAMLFEAGYDEQDEELVRRLGNVLTQVIGDNAETFDKLFEMEEAEI